MSRVAGEAWVVDTLHLQPWHNSTAAQQQNRINTLAAAQQRLTQEPGSWILCGKTVCVEASASRNPALKLKGKKACKV